ncbi:putative aryl-alcohol dehydrogenase AAD14 [Colletotrichum tanaceti]|uniref:Aldo-keto reductase ausK n=1 Tax=Colletotrichum tanaceti TaxID=1306861 RepID=A0A4U6X8A6_9PEZI|nr:putative aryl-alcohol dehydrogenase AAD14 [Colletotrichum tanaceti]TKW51761.1 putative aryl-alcohol dehydrogenase AAD14 [Colletotrichum tanaceti]
MSNFLALAPEPPTELGRLRVLSPTAGIRVSPLALGAMSIGDAWAAEGMGAMDKEQSFRLLDAFFEAGGNFIDTANGYQDEQSEQWIGDWMAERGNREQMVLATKYSSDYRSHALGKGRTANFTGNHRRSLHASVRDSLRKLGTDYLDILYLHWWDYTTSIKEVVDSLHMLVEQGRVLYLGVSDTPAWVVSAANTYAVDHGKTPFSVYQGRWSVMHRDFERDILPMARMFGMALCPWDVLGAGKFQSKRAVEERGRAGGEGLRSFAGTGRQQTEAEMRISEALERVAAEHGTDSVTAVALAYVRGKAANVVPVVGGRKVEHLRANIDALAIRLTDEQVAYLESVRDFDVGFPTNFLGEDPNITGRSARLSRAAQMSFPNAGRQTSI